MKGNRYDGDLQLNDLATGTQHPLTFERRGVTQRWSPDGSAIAFLANASSDRDAKRQIWVLPVTGGDAKRITSGGWSLPIVHPPGPVPVPSPLSWSSEFAEYLK